MPLHIALRPHMPQRTVRVWEFSLFTIGAAVLLYGSMHPLFDAWTREIFIKQKYWISASLITMLAAVGSTWALTWFGELAREQTLEIRRIFRLSLSFLVLAFSLQMIHVSIPYIFNGAAETSMKFIYGWSIAVGIFIGIGLTSMHLLFVSYELAKDLITELNRCPSLLYSEFMDLITAIKENTSEEQLKCNNARNKARDSALKLGCLIEGRWSAYQENQRIVFFSSHQQDANLCASYLRIMAKWIERPIDSTSKDVADILMYIKKGIKGNSLYISNGKLAVIFYNAKAMQPKAGIKINVKLLGSFTAILLGLGFFLSQVKELLQMFIL